MKTLDDSTPLDEVGMSTRLGNCLRTEGLETVGDVRAKTRTELLLIENLGRRSLDEAVHLFGLPKDMNVALDRPTTAKKNPDPAIADALIQMARALNGIHEELKELKFIARGI